MKTFESFQSNRWIWRVNILLQVLLVFVLTAIVNYIGMIFVARYDITRNHSMSLSPETVNYVKQLTEPVTIIVTINSDDDNPLAVRASRDVMALLREYEFAARGNGRGTISVKRLNVYEKRVQAEQLGVAGKHNVVVFQSGASKPVTLELRDLYEIVNYELGRFNGERAFTTALRSVQNQKKPVLYSLKGHDEMGFASLDPGRGASQLEAELIARNYDVRALDLTETRRVPEDAEMVLLLAPRSALLRSEQALLRNYLSTDAGRMLILLDPGAQAGLDDLLLDWGILADDAIVVEKDPASRIPGGDLLIRHFAIDHPITQQLHDFGLRVTMGAARSVRPDPGRPIDDSLVVNALFQTSENSWGERNTHDPKPTFDPAQDIPGPVFIGAVSERKVGSSANLKLRGGRLIVFGNSDFIANNRINSAANLTLFRNAVSWSLSNLSQLEIPARPIQRLQLTLSEEQLTVGRILIVAGPALLVALFGFTVFLGRRR